MKHSLGMPNLLFDSQSPLQPALHPKRLAVIGSGYVGLVSGACFAEAGHWVVCVDRDPQRIEALKQGRIPIYEPGLEDLVKRNMEAGRLSFTEDGHTAVSDANLVFLAVGTPTRPRDGGADLSQLFAAARGLAPALKRSSVVVTKSTVPVGTGDELERILREVNPSVLASVASNPEFLREGSAIADFMRPDRIVIGSEDELSRCALAAVYQPFDSSGARTQFTARRTAELIKYAANAFLAMKITFINEVADLCEKVGADVDEIARGIGADSRIGPQFLRAGPGYGGSCFPKDTLALARVAQDAGAPLRLVEATAAINDVRKRRMAAKIIEACGGGVRGKTIALLGLTFKPETDDMRESPALSIIDALQDAGATIKAYDPHGMAQARQMSEGVLYCASAYEAAEGADALTLVTEWEEFARLDFRRLGRIMRARVVVDLRNFLDAAEAVGHGFGYTGMGRPLEARAHTVSSMALLAAGE